MRVKKKEKKTINVGQHQTLKCHKIFSQDYRRGNSFIISHSLKPDNEQSVGPFE